MNKTGVAAVLTTLTMTAACGSGDIGRAQAGETPSAQPTPTPQTLTVVLTDAAPFSVFHNYDGRCSSQTFADAFASKTTPLPEVVVRDAKGTIVATRKAPQIGGRFTRAAGCRYPVDLQVPDQGIYEVTVTVGSTPRTVTTTVDTAAAQRVLLDF